LIHGDHLIELLERHVEQRLVKAPGRIVDQNVCNADRLRHRAKDQFGRAWLGKIGDKSDTAIGRSGIIVEPLYDSGILIDEENSRTASDEPASDGESKPIGRAGDDGATSR
jgi:hypothetical protein